MALTSQAGGFALPRHFLHSRWGSFQVAREPRVEQDFAPLFAFMIDVPMTGMNRTVHAAGSAFTREQASLSAFGEAVERLGLFSYSPADIRWDSFAHLGARALDPARCLHYPADVYARNQLGIAPFDPAAPGAWYEAYNLTGRRRQYLPAVFAFNELTPDFPLAARWDRPVSTGGACHPDTSRAMLTGLYEVLERDALMIHWENRLTGTPHPVPSELTGVRRELERRGFSLRLVELPTDFDVPVALAVVLDETNRRPAMAVGSAARATWPLAAAKALEEAFLGMLWMTVRRSTNPLSETALWEALSRVPEPVHHADFYASRKNLSHCAFLWEGTRRLRSTAPEADAARDSRSWPSAAAELEWLRAEVESRGHEVFVTDITPPEGAEFGLYVLRMLVPGLVPLSRGLHLRPLLNPRLRQVPEFFGQSGYHLPEGHPAPHPLP